MVCLPTGAAQTAGFCDHDATAVTAALPRGRKYLVPGLRGITHFRQLGLPSSLQARADACPRWCGFEPAICRQLPPFQHMPACCAAWHGTAATGEAARPATAYNSA